MAENRISLQRYAMRFGTYMGVYWIIKFIFLPLGFTNPLLMFGFYGLTFAVPFIAYYFVRSYRDKVCGGEISFLQSWLFLIFMFMFAALLTAVVHFIYFRFIDNGFMINTMETIFSQFPAELQGLEAYKEQMDETLKLLRAMTPIELTMQLLSTNFLYCSILSLIIAPFVMKRKITPNS